MKIRTKVTIGLLSSAMCVVALAHAAGYEKVDGNENEVITFETSAMKGTVDIKGHVKLNRGKMEGSDLVLKAELFKLVFNEDPKDQEMDRMGKMRFDHAKNELDFKKFPMVQLKVPKADTLALGANTGKGFFSLHGVTKPVKFTYKAKPEGGQIQVDGEFTLKLSDYGIKEICKGDTVCVKDEVLVKAAFKLKKS